MPLIFQSFKDFIVSMLFYDCHVPCEPCVIMSINDETVLSCKQLHLHGIDQTDTRNHIDRRMFTNDDIMVTKGRG